MLINIYIYIYTLETEPLEIENIVIANWFDKFGPTRIRGIS